jgi:hypothetical protein
LKWYRFDHRRVWPLYVKDLTTRIEGVAAIDNTLPAREREIKLRRSDGLDLPCVDA